MADEFSDAEILEQLLVLVSDLSLLVSYKWLSRKFSISSNAAKRLLDKFVDKHGDGLEVVYVVSGYLLDEPRSYSIQLVKLSQLQGARSLFAKEPCVHIYSVQASIPRDPGQLWKPDHVQAQELFNQPPQVINCLRDNRFSGVSCSYVKRDVKGKVSSVAPPPEKPAAQQQAAAAKSTKSSQDATVSHGETSKGAGAGSSKQAASGRKTNNREVAKPEPSRNGKKPKRGKGSSIANLWERSKSSKPSPPKEESAEKPLPANADACINAVEEHENGASSDDNVTHFRRLRRGGRKRHVVLDDDLSEHEEEAESQSPVQDEDEPVISLISPEKKPDVKAADETKPRSSAELVTKSVDLGKRRKVLKTHIDARGREVSEVVWETEETDTNTNTSTKASARKESSKVEETENKPPEAKAAASKKAAAAAAAPPSKQLRASTSKAPSKVARGKKAAAVGPQQGSITSFFKKK